MQAKLEIQILDIRASDIDRGVRQGLLSAGKEINALASILSPKDTGELARSGKVEETPNGVEISYGNDIEDARAVVQEYGSIFQPAQPYLLPAVRTVDVLFFIQDALDTVIKGSLTKRSS